MFGITFKADFRRAAGTRQVVAATMAGAICALPNVPALAAEWHMGVSAHVLSHCSLQVANTGTLAVAPQLNARCNTGDKPRLALLASGATLPTAARRDSVALSAPRTRTHLVSAGDAEHRVVQYIQYTIEY